MVLLLCMASFAQGQNIKDTVRLNAVVFTGNKHFKKEKAGSKETIVDSMVLCNKVNASLSDVLSENTPVFIKSHGRGALATASFRGTAPSHTQVFWNGINLNSPMLGMVDFSLIPVYLIDDLSLKHGAASIADQSGGLGGSITISNTPDWQNRFGGRYIQGIGSFQTFDEALQINVGNRKLQAKTRLYHTYSKNDYPYINRNIRSNAQDGSPTIYPEAINKNADYKRYGLLQEFYGMPNMQNSLSVKWWLQKAQRSIPTVTSNENPENSNLNQQDNFDSRLVADWTHYWGQSKLLIRSAYNYKTLDYVLKNQVAGQALIPAIYSESLVNSWFNKVQFVCEFEQGWSVEGSLAANHHWVNSQDSVKKTGYSEARQEYLLFVAARKTFFDRLNLNLILRQDLIAGEQAVFIPFLGFDYRILSKHDWFLKGNIARNYHHPTLNDLYWQPGGNPNLRPEEGISYELSTLYATKLGKHKIESELTAFYADIIDWIIWLPSFKGYWQSHNIKRVISKGLEFHLQADGRLGAVGYKLRGNYSLTRSLNYGDPAIWGDESYGKQLVYVPVHSGNLLASINYKGFHLSWQHNSYSERFTTSSNDISRRDWLYPYYMNNLSFGKTIDGEKCSLAVKLKIYNLFDESYRSALLRPMPERHYSLMMMFNF